MKTVLPKVEKNIFIQSGQKTLTKTRYVNEYRKLKIFEVYNQDKFEINEECERKILDYLKKNISRFDLVICADYGHGIISPCIRDYLAKANIFLAVYCQLNGGNLNFNFITKYERADFVSLAESAIRFPFQEDKSDIIAPIKKLSAHLGAEKINVTLGKTGAAYYQNGRIFNTPSFTHQVVDTMGVDDAILAITSLLACKNVKPELVPFLGNCIGALAVKIMGNTASVDPVELKKFISYILK